MVTKTKNNLSEKAMLINLRISMWTGRTKDRRITSEVISNNKSQTDSGAWWTYLIPKKNMAAINNASGKLRSLHYSLTLPWMDGGLRILPSAMFMNYAEKMRKAIAEYDKVTDEFIKEYPTIIANAQERLGQLLDGKKLPTTNEIRDRFGVSKDVMPLPSTNDFRVKLGDAEVNQIKKQMTISINEMTENAMADLWSRFAELIEKVEHTLGKSDKIFRDSMISNLKEFCDLVPNLNMTDDEALEAVRKEVTEKLTNLMPENLRKNKKERQIAHKDAQDILKKMKGYTTL